MASIIPQTVQDLMDMIYVAIDNDPTSSAAGPTDDEWTSRLRLMNMAIQAWERQDVYWNELWKLYTHGSTISATQTYTISATDWHMPGSYVSFVLNGSTTYVEVIKPEEAYKYVKQGAKACFITGNPSSGWTINLTWLPATGDQFFGATMSLYYYKAANKMAVASDTPEMSDPSYIVNFVSYRKNLYNGRANVAQDYLASSQECMDNMRIRNEMRVHYGSSALEDTDLFRTNSYLGG